jgi:parvulin-like peptidyl-prolyl isomerase
MATSRRSSLSAEQEADAQALAQRIGELAEEEFLQIARLLVSKPDREIFGETEFEIRDILLQAGAKALEERLRQKKTATTDAVSIVGRVNKRRSFKAIAPSHRRAFWVK